MKVCIVTVHDIVNSGSFWQAYALGKKCEESGCDVVYLKRPKFDFIKYRTKHFIKAIGTMVLKNFNGGILKLKTDRNFYKSKKIFKEINMNRIDSVDLVIVGSDTMWNIEDDYFNKNYKRFFGGEFNNKKQITYAVSAANSSVEQIEKLPEIRKMINRFSGISVRDNNTKNIASKLYNKDIYFVCDPTLLLNKDGYNNFINKNSENDKYIFLYLFKSLTKQQQQEVIEFAKDNQLTIIDGIGCNTWANKQIDNSPEKFLEHINGAEYVITDTFHGTIFSTNFNKNFVSIDRGKNKVFEFLKYFNLEDRLVNNEKISEKFSNSINYDDINRKIESLREESNSYLNKFLNN